MSEYIEREMLFRGKRTDNSKWVYGIPARFRNIDNVVRSCIIQEMDGEHIMSGTVGVNPDTVGQFTELIDKNGVKIFEGDIVQTREIGQLVVGNTYTGADRIRRGVVRYIGGAFEVIYDSSIFGHEMDDDEPENAMDLSAAYSMYGATVVGNIYDNPELLNA